MYKKEYVIRMPKNSAERTRALTFIDAQMLKAYGSSPSRTAVPKELFLAMHDKAIIGTLATQYGTRNTPLPFEKLFEFDCALLPLPYERAKTIYYSRWTSATSGAGQIIWLAATKHAAEQGRTTSAAMIKRFVEEQFLKFGCEWKPIPGARIRPHMIAPGDHKYFFEGPPPYPCMGVISEQIRRLPDIVKHLKEKHHISVRIDL